MLQIHMQYGLVYSSIETHNKIFYMGTLYNMAYILWALHTVCVK